MQYCHDTFCRHNNPHKHDIRHSLEPIHDTKQYVIHDIMYFLPLRVHLAPEEAEPDLQEE